MQQYFISEKISINNNVTLNDEIVYHLRTVLRGTNKTFRLCDIDKKIYLCHLDGNTALPFEELNENNELNVKITAIISLIKQDKFELILQKLTELGVDRIIPYNASRSIVKENKKDKKLERYKKIIREAAEQSHRNKIPEIINAINIDEIKNYMSDINIIPYEKEDAIESSFDNVNSISFIIGPEGGFEDKEYTKIVNLGFKSISLGKRILRAETAAIYITSIIVGNCQ